jgi:hypothetical protein
MTMRSKTKARPSAQFHAVGQLRWCRTIQGPVLSTGAGGRHVAHSSGYGWPPLCIWRCVSMVWRKKRRQGGEVAALGLTNCMSKRANEPDAFIRPMSGVDASTRKDRGRRTRHARTLRPSWLACLCGSKPIDRWPYEACFSEDYAVSKPQSLLDYHSSAQWSTCRLMILVHFAPGQHGRHPDRAVGMKSGVRLLSWGP